MNCIKCGRPISEGELFCVECSLMPRAGAPSSAPAKAATRGKAAADKTGKSLPRQKTTETGKTAARAAAPKSAAPKSAAPEPLRQRPVKLIVGLTSMCLLVVGLMAFIVLNWGQLLEQKAGMRVREADLILREADVTELEKQLAETQGKLDTANKELVELREQLSELNNQLYGTQSTMSQTQYDMTTQQKELARLTGENTQLTDTVQQLQRQADDLTARLTSLNASNAAYGAKADFLDAYVVFVNNDGSKLYHKYDCKEFKRQSFWAYSRKLAESSGFAACPNCCE